MSPTVIAPAHVATTDTIVAGDQLQLHVPGWSTSPPCTVLAVHPESRCFVVAYSDAAASGTVKISDWGWQDGHGYATTADEPPPSAGGRRVLDVLDALEVETSSPESTDGYASGVRRVAQSLRQVYAAASYHHPDPQTLTNAAARTVLGVAVDEARAVTADHGSDAQARVQGVEYAAHLAYRALMRS